MIEYKILRGSNTAYLAPKLNPLGEEGFRVMDVTSWNNDTMEISLVKDDYSIPTTDYIAKVDSQGYRIEDFINTNLANGYKLDGVSVGGSSYVGAIMHKEYDPVKEYAIVDTPDGEDLEALIKAKQEEGFILEEIKGYGNRYYRIALMKRLK